MTMTYDGTNGITFPDSSLQKTAGYSPFRNRIINGDMRIDQRNSGASVTPSSSGTYTVDRWRSIFSQASKFSFQQNAGSVTPPVGFKNYLGATVVSSVSVGSSDYFIVGQSIEGLNVADLGWGTANAQSVTVSFFVRSSLSGTFGGSIQNSDSTRSYPFSYSISSANTWEQKSITISGDTAGTWLSTNGIGISVFFGLGVGSSFGGTAGSWASSNYVSATGATSVVGTNGATFYITGVQLEKGSVATPFEYRPYGQELALCQRYYETIDVAFGSSAWSSALNIAFWKVTKRTAPTLVSTPAGGSGGAYATNLTSPSSISSIYQSSANSGVAGGIVTGSAEL